MADVAINVSGTTERNGSVVVGAPRGAGTGALGSKYTLLPGDSTDMVNKGAFYGHNDALEPTVLDTKYDGRFDDVRYYSGDRPADA